MTSKILPGDQFRLEIRSWFLLRLFTNGQQTVNARKLHAVFGTVVHNNNICTTDRPTTITTITSTTYEHDTRNNTAIVTRVVRNNNNNIVFVGSVSTRGRGQSVVRDHARCGRRGNVFQRRRGNAVRRRRLWRFGVNTQRA